MNLNLTLKTCIALFTGVLAVSSYGQTPVKTFGKQPAQLCGFVEYEEMLKKKYPNKSVTAQFEQWIAPKVEAAKAKRSLKNGLGTNEVIVIPVVVHVVHNGDILGTNENISAEQIQSQITVLNQDFRKMLDTNGYNDNPLGADIEVEFCLAQRDPDGFATNGITRHNIGNDIGFSLEEVEFIKTQLQWDPEQYLNIWTFNYIYTGNSVIYGYAQFPTQSGLDGINNEEIPGLAETDGLAITANCFGSEEIYPGGTYSEVNNLGRTTTHEMGHFFGLRHIWGDGGCSADDYCEDTPVSGQANSGCPTGIDTCPGSPGNDMIENYMDYTNDACKNIFTLNQKDRITAVLANSPRRASLAASLGCTPGNTIENDGSLELFINSECNVTYTPAFILRNTGSNAITTATISYSVDGGEEQIYNWSGSLAAGEEEAITLTETTAAAGNHEMSAEITSINNIADAHIENNAQTGYFKIISNYVTDEIVITINTDDWGYESLWVLFDSNHELVEMSNEEYGDNQTYTANVSLDGGQCYIFVMVDLAGDGFESGAGYEVRSASDNALIAQGSQFGEMELTSFGVDIMLGKEEIQALLNNVMLYPNPTNGILNIKMPNSELPESYTIYNNIGQVVASSKISSQSNLSIETTAYSNGIYFIKIEKNGAAQTLKFIKN